ncbi:hypothetical protein ACLBX9_17240 [Methylobacterium sp. A49B]
MSEALLGVAVDDFRAIFARRLNFKAYNLTDGDLIDAVQGSLPGRIHVGPRSEGFIDGDRYGLLTDAIAVIIGVNWSHHQDQRPDASQHRRDDAAELYRRFVRRQRGEPCIGLRSEFEHVRAAINEKPCPSSLPQIYSRIRHVVRVEIAISP